MGLSTNEKNDLHYVCSLIEFLGRTTKRTTQDIVNILGTKEIGRQLWLADTNHCLTFEEVADELIEKYNIQTGNFDNIEAALFKIPSYIAIGSVYRNLVEDIYQEGDDTALLIYQVFDSFISPKISDFNSSMYYENPSYLKECYLSNEVLM